MSNYRGRLAPTPTGLLHLGHAVTFGLAWLRAKEAGGSVIYRDEDLDPQRCQPMFSEAAMEDLHWLGLDWEPAWTRQSQRRDHYFLAWEWLVGYGHIYPSMVSRKDLRELADVRAPQEGAEEPIFPPELRPPPGTDFNDAKSPADATWRFRVPDGREIRFEDARLGPQCFVAGRDFGDFVVWRRDDVPAYELAVVVDDYHQGVSEVVRGQDLLLSTARQLLVYEALDYAPPSFYHTPLLRDSAGQRLAKRSAGLTLRELRARGITPEALMDWTRAVAQALKAGEDLPPPPVPELRW